MIALLCSIPAECDALRQSLAGEEILTVGSKNILKGILSDQHVALCAGGMGKANAAHAATVLITQCAPEALVIFGVGGAYPSSGAKVGDIALAVEEIAGDEGVITREGFKDAEYMGIPLAKTDSGAFYNLFPAAERLLRRAQSALSSAVRTTTEGNVKMQDLTPRVGRFVTLSACTGTLARAKELEALYRPLCENMEGAAAAQVALLHSIPWLELRGISNMVENRDLKKWNIPRAAQAVQEAVLHILEGWTR